MELNDRPELGDKLADLASDAMDVLKEFLDKGHEFTDRELKRAKYASVALGAWARWEQTSTARSALRLATEREIRAGLPLGAGMDGFPLSREGGA